MYLTEDDYKNSIKDYRLQQIIDNDTTKLDFATDIAVSTVKDYLNDLYRTDIIFSKTGAQRDSNVVRWTLMLAIYYLYDRIEDNLVPERIIKNHDDTIAHLKLIALGKINANLPKKTAPDGKPKTRFRWGSNRQNSQ